MTQKRFHFAFLLLLLAMSLGFAATAGRAIRPPARIEPPKAGGEASSAWQKVDQLISEQKNEAASAMVEKMLAEAKAKKDNAEWTRCLIRYTQLRISLHGYETSVRFLKDQPWPEDLTGSSVLNLYYAHSLANYARM
jgi:hypothetical protein